MLQQSSNIIVSIAWKQPTGSGPEYFVESYGISVISETTPNNINGTVGYTFWNTTLEYNVRYTVSVMSINCAGMSDPIMSEGIMFGKL